MRSIRVFCSLLIISMAWSMDWSIAWAQGGPPLVTDDPGTPGDGHWEINLAGLLNSSAGQNLIQLPYLDINYGLGERIQLKLETGWVTSTADHLSTQSGFDTLLLGVKVRFLDEETAGISISTYPQLQIHPSFSSSNPELAEPGTRYTLPVELLKTFGNWELNPEVGYLCGSAVPSELFYGVVLAFEKAKPWEPLAEVHVNTRLNGTGSSTLINLGARYEFTPHLIGLAAAGHTITHTTDSATELDLYLGTQLVF